MPIRIFLPVIVCAWLAVPAVLASDSMRCGSKLTSVGDHAAEVLAACDEPSFRDVRSVGRDGRLADAEVWTYNFGPRQLIYVLTIRNGRLSNIVTDGHGFSTRTRQNCVPTDISEGLSKYRLLARCGNPFTRREIGYVQTVQASRRFRHGGLSTSGGSHYRVEVYREEWVYNFGSRYLLRIITLEDGLVANVDKGDRGFSSRRNSRQ